MRVRSVKNENNGLRGQVINVTSLESLAIHIWRFEIHPERWRPYVSKPFGRSKFLHRRVHDTIKYTDGATFISETFTTKRKSSKTCTQAVVGFISQFLLKTCQIS